MYVPVLEPDVEVATESAASQLPAHVATKVATWWANEHLQRCQVNGFPVDHKALKQFTELLAVAIAHDVQMLNVCTLSTEAATVGILRSVAHRAKLNASNPRLWPGHLTITVEADKIMINFKIVDLDADV